MVTLRRWTSRGRVSLASADPGTDTIDHWTINWGDGSAAQTVSGNPSDVVHTFADNGKGIESISKTRIFEPLYTTKGAIGTGLGLWVTKEIVDKHRGSIKMHSSTHKRI